MNDRKIKIVFLILLFINLSTEIFILIYYVWMTKAIKVAFIIFFCLNIGFYILTFLFILQITDIIVSPFIFYLMNNLIYLIILSVNLGKFKKYWKYCPYLITDFDYNLHFERRCELYNINHNSRYLYQYICSYDSSKDFKKNNLKKEIKIDNIICIPVKEIKENEYNKVKKLFINEYKNINNYYCSKTDMPKNYSFVNHKDCKKTKYALNIALYITLIFEYIFFYIISYFLLLCSLANSNLNRMRRRRQINISNNEEIRNNFPNNIERNVDSDRMQNRNLNNERKWDLIDIRFREIANEINRIRDLFRNLRNNNNNNQLNNDTKASENPYLDNSFIKQKTRNIILENKQEYSIETNIKNIITNKDNKINNAINLEEINIQILNSQNELRNNS